MAARLLAPAVAVALAAPPAIARHIIGGTDASAFTSVVYVSREAIECTGTLVGGRLFLTAAHCVPATPASRVFVSGEALGARQTAVCVRHVQYNDHAPHFDVAVCEIEEDLSGLPAEALGDSVRVPGEVTYVGYGPVDPGEAAGGTGSRPPKAKGQGSVASTRHGTLLIEGPGTLRGDSGGPVFLGPATSRGPLVGILSCSFGPDRQPRAVDLTNHANARWLRRCLRDFARCRTFERQPAAVEVDEADRLCAAA